MACRLFGAKQLSESIVAYCWLYPWEQISVKFEVKYISFHTCKLTKKSRLQNGGYFVSASMC